MGISRAGEGKRFFFEKKKRKTFGKQLVVRNLNEDVKHRLRERADRRGRSMEEVREILRLASLESAPAVAPLGTRFAGLGLRAELPELRGQTARPAEFGE